MDKLKACKERYAASIPITESIHNSMMKLINDPSTPMLLKEMASEKMIEVLTWHANIKVELNQATLEIAESHPNIPEEMKQKCRQEVEKFKAELAQIEAEEE